MCNRRKNSIRKKKVLEIRSKFNGRMWNREKAFLIERSLISGE